jgi:peroxiredoxin
MSLSLPRIGAPAPALELPSANGAGRFSLAEVRGRPAVVSFLGPAHCTFCRAHVIRAIQHREDFERRGAEVVFVAFNDPERLMAQMLHDLDLPFTLLIDREQSAYRQWGLGRVTWRQLVVPGFYLAVLRSILRGDKDLGKAPPGPNSIGGDFVVDANGHVRFAHRMRSFHDRPRFADMLGRI